eukprot:evm.model.scf_329EXC.3 EVM.evm.TU.scf_329EXC.3   scf_329EXC:35635-43179(+)
MAPVGVLPDVLRGCCGAGLPKLTNGAAHCPASRGAHPRRRPSPVACPASRRSPGLGGIGAGDGELDKLSEDEIGTWMESGPPTPLLDTVNYPIHIKNFNLGQLRQLCKEIRSDIVHTVSSTGGHLGASLGVVELTVALNYVFSLPEDKVIWDVGHQCYGHKILTGRRSRMKTIRQTGGLSGFTKRDESPYDPFGAGHSSTSVSSGLGMAVGRDLKNKKNHVISVIGDGAITGGMSYEAMNHAGFLDKNMIVVLNDNQQVSLPTQYNGKSQDPVGALSSALARLQANKPLRELREIAKGVTKQLPNPIQEATSKIDEYARGMISGSGSTLFEELGLYYIGPVDGHNLDDLIAVLKEVKNTETVGPVLIHIVTEKGRGYLPAESASDKMHGVVKYDPMTGKQFKKQVRFAMDRAGLVGADGATHCGAFDVTYMACLPNMVVMAPSNEAELINMVATAAAINDRPSCLRYPRGNGIGVDLAEHGIGEDLKGTPLEIGKGVVRREGTDVALVGYGSAVNECLKAAETLADLGVSCTVVDARFCKPLDGDLLKRVARDHPVMITVEEGAIGGFGSHVLSYMALEGLLDGGVKVRPMTLPDRFIEHGAYPDQLSEAGLTADHIASTALKLIGKSKDAMFLMQQER